MSDLEPEYSPGWIITYDHLENMPVNIIGPRDANVTEVLEWSIPFRLYDDDANLYYSGMMDKELNPDETVDPLYGYGMPNAGAVRMDIFNEAKDEWEQWIS